MKDGLDLDLYSQLATLDKSPNISLYKIELL